MGRYGMIRIQVRLLPTSQVRFSTKYCNIYKYICVLLVVYSMGRGCETNIDLPRLCVKIMRDLANEGTDTNFTSDSSNW